MDHRMWPDATNTQELLDQAKAGKADAVEQLLAKHREPIRRMIDLRLDPAIAGRLDASDVVQEVLIEANRRLHDYLKAPAMPFHLWLRHIAKRSEERRVGKEGRTGRSPHTDNE